MKENNIKINLIAGCGHTGSSIFARVIGEHSKIYFPTKETNTFLLYNDFDQKKLLEKLKKNCLKANKEQILEKTNRHIWHIDYIRSKYKNFKFILITRDPRDVIASLYKRNVNKNIKTLQNSIIRYRDDSMWTIRQIGNKDTILVRYEDFIKDPKKISKHVFKFMNLKYEKDIMNYHKNTINSYY